MNIGAHIRFACYFTVVTVFVVLMSSVPGAGAPIVSAPAFNCLSHIADTEDSDLTSLEFVKAHARPAHSALRSKLKAKVFLRYASELPAIAGGIVHNGINSVPYRVQTDRVRPDYYNFLFRYTPF